MRAATEVMRQRAAGAAVLLLNVPRGTITRTTSGKIKRRELWRAFVKGTLTGIPAS